MDSKTTKTTIQKFLNIDGLQHFITLITSFVANYASPKNHVHDDRYYTKQQIDNGVVTQGVIPISKGGTGATTPSGAQQNLYPKNYGAAGYPGTLYLTGFGNGFADPGHLTASQLRGQMGLGESGAVPLASKANGVVDTGDGRTLTFNYSATGMDSVKWYAAWNGNELQSVSYKIVGLEAYPVGAIYISYSSTSPASLFGGSWIQIKEAFLWAAGSASSIGSTGGSKTHTLNASQMPSHNHQYNGNHSWDWLCYNGIAGSRSENAPFSHVPAGRYGLMANDSGFTMKTVTAVNSGSNQPHNNMPPYVEVFAWRRTG